MIDHMSLKGVVNVGAVLLSVIAGLLSFVTFVLSSFYSTAQAQWAEGARFRALTETRLQNLESDARAQRDATAKDIQDIKLTLGQIIEVKLRKDPRGPPQ